METDANTSLVLVPAPFLKDAVLESLDAGINTTVIYTEGVPVHDAMNLVAYAKVRGLRIIGPNAAGVVSPGKANVSDLNDQFLKTGQVGIVSKSGTLSYEFVHQLIAAGIGLSTVCCLGGDAIIGLRFTDVLAEFENDEQTRSVILLGEPGGTDELEACKIISAMSKSVHAFINGRFVPPNKKMGHAGAIVTGRKDAASCKVEALKSVGVPVGETVEEIVNEIANELHVIQI